MVAQINIFGAALTATGRPRIGAPNGGSVGAACSAWPVQSGQPRACEAEAATDVTCARNRDGRQGTIQRMPPPESGLPGNIGAPATRALTAAGYTELRQLANVPAADMRKLHGVGPKALRLLQEALEQQGMSLS